MKDLDDVEINNLRKPYDMVQSISVHCGEHELRRGPTDPTILNRNKPFPMSKSDEQVEDSVDLHKSGQLRPLHNLTKKQSLKPRKKINQKQMARGFEERSTEMTKKKPSAKKKMSSVSNEKGSTVDPIDEIVKALKHQIKAKEGQLRYYKKSLEKLQGMTEDMQKKVEQGGLSTIQASFAYIKGEVETQLMKSLPSVAKFLNVLMNLLEQPLLNANHKNSNWSNLHTQAPLTPISFDPSTLLKKDIQFLEEKLIVLKQQGTKLRNTLPPSNDMLLKLRQTVKEQDEKLISLMQMQQIMQQAQRNKKVSVPGLKGRR